MTEHPLTVEIFWNLWGKVAGHLTQKLEFRLARAAADWQLEQVIEWLKVNLMKHDFHEGYAYLYDDCSNAEIEVDKVLEDLKQAMRPQQQEKN
jgi:hypothetical protein